MNRHHGNKYGAKKTIVDGIKFDSKGEAEHYSMLQILEKAGDLKILELQPKVYLTKAKILYKPDFKIEEQGKVIFIDYKGFETTMFRLKKRLWKHYGAGTLRIVSKSETEEVVTC